MKERREGGSSDLLTFDEALNLIGEDRLPRGGGIPAAWWITTDPAQVEAYDRWKADYDAHVVKVEKLCEELGVPLKSAMVWTGFKNSELTGFAAPQEMRLWPDHPNFRNPPPGWYVNKKKDYLLPIRKTKADRESQANKDFAAVRKVPCVRAYMSGLPAEIYLDNRDFGGTSYLVSYMRGDQCVWAYSGGDPDRCRDTSWRKFEIDEKTWHRQRLSVLVALTEHVGERAEGLT